jgi:hypothetical protein
MAFSMNPNSSPWGERPIGEPDFFYMNALGIISHVSYFAFVMETCPNRAIP